jgi:hypothetical protein
MGDPSCPVDNVSNYQHVQHQKDQGSPFEQKDLTTVVEAPCAHPLVLPVPLPIPFSALIHLETYTCTTIKTKDNIEQEI